MNLYVDTDMNIGLHVELVRGKHLGTNTHVDIDEENRYMYWYQISSFGVNIDIVIGYLRFLVSKTVRIKRRVWVTLTRSFDILTKSQILSLIIMMNFVEVNTTMLW